MNTFEEFMKLKEQVPQQQVQQPQVQQPQVQPQQPQPPQTQQPQQPGVNQKQQAFAQGVLSLLQQHGINPASVQREMEPILAKIK